MEITINNKQLIQATKLFRKLVKNNHGYNQWIKLYLLGSNTFKENEDYDIVGLLETGRMEYLLTIDTALAVVMAQRTENRIEIIKELMKADTRDWKPTDKREIWLGTSSKKRGTFKAFVDHEDYFRIGMFHWNAKQDYNVYYAYAHIQGKNIPMHRLVLNLTDYRVFPDHKDRNGLNNQKSNLRKATTSQNAKNNTAHGSSKYIGVSWDKTFKKFDVRIDIGNRNRIFVGKFKSEQEAALMFDLYAMKYHKEFASLNFPNISPYANQTLLKNAKHQEPKKHSPVCNPCNTTTTIILENWYNLLHK